MRSLFGRSPFLAAPLRPQASFPVELSNGTRSEHLEAGFDTGMTGAHLEIPSTLAAALGLPIMGTEMLVDASGRRPISVSYIDRLKVDGAPGCLVEGAKVWFFEGAPVLIGNDFMRDAGASISYSPDGPTITCGKPSRDGSLPKFRISLEQGEERLEVPAAFDTAWTSSDLALPEAIADALGIPVLGEEVEPTPTGSYRALVARIDGMSLSDQPECRVENARVRILPKSSPLPERVIVGEPFFLKTAGVVGYGPDGPFYRCGG